MTLSLIGQFCSVQSVGSYGNSVLFDKEFILPYYPVIGILSKLKTFPHANESLLHFHAHHRVEKLIGWFPPMVDSAKLNADGVMKKSSGSTSAGGIINS